MITKREITEALALSCVESYFLAWLAKRFDVSKLYGESFVPIGQVFDDFAQGAKYEAYEGVPRIQETAEKAGIAAHVYSVFPMGVPGSREKLAECLKNQREEDLCLMHVNEAFFAEYKRKAWREDHYICVDGSLCWLNQYPLSEGRFTEERLKEVSGNAVCTYAFRNGRADTESDCEKKIRTQTFSSVCPPRESEKTRRRVGSPASDEKTAGKIFFRLGKNRGAIESGDLAFGQALLLRPSAAAERGKTSGRVQRGIKGNNGIRKKDCGGDEMNREEIEKKIVDLARETTGAQLTETVTLKENGLDSLSLVLLIASIEEAYSFSFDEDDLQPDKLLTLKDLTLLTEKYL